MKSNNMKGSEGNLSFHANANTNSGIGGCVSLKTIIIIISTAWVSLIIGLTLNHPHVMQSTTTSQVDIKHQVLTSKISSNVDVIATSHVTKNYDDVIKQIQPLRWNYESRELLNMTSQRIIVMDWDSHPDNFSYINYKSFESFLTSSLMKGDKIEVTILATKTAGKTRCGSSLSFQQFSKYTRRGYDVHVYSFSTIGNLYRLSESAAKGAVLAGDAYFTQEATKCYSSTPYVFPSHFWAFSRFVRLYAHGGEYYDFSWFHQKRIFQIEQFRNIQQGAYLENYCFNVNSQETLSELPFDLKSFKLKNESAVVDWDCHTRSMMIFVRRNHPVLECVIDKYDLGSQLNLCLQNVDTVASSFPHFNSMKSYLYGICIQNAVNECFQNKKMKNELMELMQLHAAGVQVENYIWQEDSIALDDTVGTHMIVPLGGNSVLASWNVPSFNSYLDAKIQQNNFALRNITIVPFLNNMLESQNTQDITFDTIANIQSKIGSNTGHSCYHYKTWSDSPASAVKQAKRSCAVSFVLPGFMKSGTSYLFDLLTQHPQVLLTLKGTMFKETGCLFESTVFGPTPHTRMGCFPFIEPHEPFVFGDGTVYYAQRYRVAKFLKQENPNTKAIFILRDPIERACSHHRFSYDQYVQQGLGDINVVVDISLDKNKKLHQLHVLAKNALHGYYQRIIRGIDYSNTGPKFVETYRSNMNSSEYMDIRDNVAMRRFIEYFHYSRKTPAEEPFDRASHTLFHSIYFPCIYGWDYILGSDNVYVIETEKLDPASKYLSKRINYTDSQVNRKSDDELNNIYSFLGLPKSSRLRETINEHKTTVKVPQHHQLNETSRQRLEEFYRPFNELLKIFLFYHRQVRFMNPDKKLYRTLRVSNGK